MKSKYDGKSVFNNFFWRFFERVGAQLVTFVVSIILARILDPEVYGKIALVTVFTTILNVFVDSGLGTALIQKKNADDIDFSTVFYTNICFCLLIYIVIFLCAPLIAVFYNDESLIPVTRILSLIIVISGVKNVQQAYVSRNMLFKKFFFSTLGGTICAAIVGIVMALCGYGIWALIAQMLINALIDTIILWLTVKWRPKLTFSITRLKSLFSYGWKLLLSSLIDVAYNELSQLLIGKIYTKSDLAFYNQGDKFPKLIVSNINGSINSVLLPSMSNEQDDKLRVKAMTQRAIKTSAYIMMPLMTGLAVCAEPIVRIVLTDKWIDCVFFLRIFCFSYAFWPIHTANLNAIKAIGKSGMFLKLEIIKKIVGLLSIISTVFISVKAMAYGIVFANIASQIINALPNKKSLSYSYFEQLKDIIPAILISLIMGALVYVIQFIGLNDVVTLLIQVPTGCLIYLLLSKLMHIDSLTYLLGILKR